MTRLAWAFIAGALALVAVYGAGVLTGHTTTKQEWDISKLQDKNAADAFAGKLSLLGSKLSNELNVERGKNHDLLAQQREEVQHATTVYVAVPGAAPQALPDYRFTRYAVCLWNSTGLSSGEGSGAAGTDGAAACSGAADALTISDVTPGDALDNELVNAASCRDDRATLSKAQAFLAALAAGQ